MNRQITGSGIAQRVGTWLMGLLLLVGGAVEAADYDVRVLVDVSGSMKQNDPSNLRRPALRLLADLLPDGATAGIWTFGGVVKAQVPLGVVDPAWRARAVKGIGKVHSRGQYTHIETAIQQGIRGWEVPSDGVRRSLILLTDGVVDVSKDPLDSLRSRDRILSGQLDALYATGAAVHTVALSERADHALLQTLSEASGGWYEMAEDAAQLQRIFLRLFEKSAPTDTLPLDDNRFQVDSSIDEMTLLVFVAEGAAPIQLQPPGGSAYGLAEAPAEVSWRSGEGYELITVQQPAVGEWRIIGEVDPDNRVMVVTDLRLVVADLPNLVLPGRSLQVESELQQNGQRITRQGFLELVEMQLSASTPDDEVGPIRMLDDGQGSDAQRRDGLYTRAMSDAASEGEHSLLLTVDGGSFKRRFQHHFSVRWPVDVAHSELDGEPRGRYQISVTARDDILRADSLAVSAELESPQGDRQSLEISVDTAGVWSLQTEVLALPGNYRLHLHLVAEAKRGGRLALSLPALELAGAGDPPAVLDTTVAAENAPSQPVNGWLIGGVLIALNVLVAALAFWLWRRRKRRLDDLVEMDMEEAEVSVVPAEVPPDTPENAEESLEAAAAEIGEILGAADDEVAFEGLDDASAVSFDELDGGDDVALFEAGGDAVAADAEAGPTTPRE